MRRKVFSFLCIFATALVVMLITACGASHHVVTHDVTPTASAPPTAPLTGVAPDGRAFGGSVHPPGWGHPTSQQLKSLQRQGIGVPVKAGKFKVTGTAEMYDTIDVNTVFAATNNPFAVAGYTAGYWPTYLPLRRTFPNAHAISIAISAGYHADCLDVEPGDADASQAGAWAKADIAAGFSPPCLYTSISNVPNVEYWLGQAGLSRSQYFMWCAWYRFFPGLVSGCDAVQWTDTSHNANLDESTDALYFLGIAQPPYNPTPPIDSNSYNIGYRLGYATGRSLPYKRGYIITHHGTPANNNDFNLGYNAGWKRGWHGSANAGNAAGQNAPRFPKTWNGSWNLGFDTGYATGIGNPYYGYFALWHGTFGYPSSNSAYNSGWVIGRPHGYDREFDKGYTA